MKKNYFYYIQNCQTIPKNFMTDLWLYLNLRKIVKKGDLEANNCSPQFQIYNNIATRRLRSWV